MLGATHIMKGLVDNITKATRWYMLDVTSSQVDKLVINGLGVIEVGILQLDGLVGCGNLVNDLMWCVYYSYSLSSNDFKQYQILAGHYGWCKGWDSWCNIGCIDISFLAEKH